jgi:hypothetical protein
MASNVLQDDTEQPRRVRPVKQHVVRWVVAGAVVVAAIVAGIAGWSRHGDTGGSNGSGAVATDSRIVVTLDDRGLHVTPPTTGAGIIEVAFADRRTRPTGKELLLYYEETAGVGGDLIAGPGGHPRVLLCAHTWYFVARLDGKTVGRIPFTVTGTSQDCRAVPSP